MARDYPVNPITTVFGGNRKAQDKTMMTVIDSSHQTFFKVPMFFAASGCRQVTFSLVVTGNDFPPLAYSLDLPSAPYLVRAHRFTHFKDLLRHARVKSLIFYMFFAASPSCQAPPIDRFR